MIFDNPDEYFQDSYDTLLAIASVGDFVDEWTFLDSCLLIIWIMCGLSTSFFGTVIPKRHAGTVHALCSNSKFLQQILRKANPNNLYGGMFFY